MSTARKTPTDMREVDNPTCHVCGNGSKVTVDWLKYLVWQGGGLIHKVFPDLSPGQREMMMTGIHPFCWTQLFGDDNES
jgi:hypothetical protein